MRLLHDVSKPNRTQVTGTTPTIISRQVRMLVVLLGCKVKVELTLGKSPGDEQQGCEPIVSKPSTFSQTCILLSRNNNGAACWPLFVRCPNSSDSLTCSTPKERVHSNQSLAPGTCRMLQCGVAGCAINVLCVDWCAATWSICEHVESKMNSRV